MTAVFQAVKRLSIVDESLSNTAPEHCSLYLHVAMPFISYCLFDASRNKYIALCEYRLGEPNPEELASLFSHDEILTVKGYKKTSVSIVSGKGVLVPLAYYHRADASQLLSLTCPVQLTETICADQLRYTDAVHIYSVPHFYSEIIPAYFPGASIHNAGTVLIESELLRNKHKTEPIVSLNIRQGSFDIAVTSGNQLRYYNLFTYQSIEDFIYYLLNVMEQLQLNPEKTPVRFYGDTDKQSAVSLISSKYIRHITFGSRPEGFEYSYGFAQVQPHAYATLLNQYLCE